MPTLERKEPFRCKTCKEILPYDCSYEYCRKCRKAKLGFTQRVIKKGPIDAQNKNNSK